MPPPSLSVSALRQLLAERFPMASHGAAGAVLCRGRPALDGVAGGLPRGALMEIVCAALSCGGQLIVGLLRAALRLVLSQSHALDALVEERGALAARLNPACQRRRLHEHETIAAG